MKQEEQQRLRGILSSHLQKVSAQHFAKIGDVDAVLADVMRWHNDNAMESFSKKVIAGTQEETNLEDPHFNGVAYEKELDQHALAHGLVTVFKFMVQHDGWHLDTEIAKATGVYVPSVQRYRSYLRDAVWGKHIVHRRRRIGCRIFEYRLIPNTDSLLFKTLFPK